MPDNGMINADVLPKAIKSMTVEPPARYNVRELSAWMAGYGVCIGDVEEIIHGLMGVSHG